MTRILLASAMLACAALPVHAQSTPNIVKTRQAAERAVVATNAHTAAMTADQGTSTRKASPSSPVAAPGRVSVTDTASGTTMVEAPAPKAPGFAREVFDYDRGGRRDPFVSLMNSGDLRPLISDLRLVAIALDPSGRNSVAILRDIGTKDQYRVRVGQSLGRMRVAQISAKSVMFTIEEFGYSRQEALALGAPNQEKVK
jgi:hypothetical protein